MVEIRIGEGSNIVKTEEPKKETIIITQPGKQLTKKETMIIKERVKKVPIKKETIVIKDRPKRARKQLKPNSSKTMGEMIAVMRANQQLVDEMIKVNTGIMENVVRLSSSVALLTEKINSFITRERREEMPTTVRDEMEERLEKIEKKLNNIVDSVSSYK
ncbi:MAG: hypothetical protein HZB65_01000 [Candidatus Aenigmarchaeota archaeon]|nr:hypothetical protein [Candidatus Aenigmarchaeota archaeon]